MDDNGSNSGCSFGCLDFIILCFLIGAIGGCLVTPWGTVNIDLIPPKFEVLK